MDTKPVMMVGQKGGKEPLGYTTPLAALIVFTFVFIPFKYFG